MVVAGVCSKIKGRGEHKEHKEYKEHKEHKRRGEHSKGFQEGTRNGDLSAVKKLDNEKNKCILKHK